MLATNEAEGPLHIALCHDGSNPVGYVAYTMRSGKIDHRSRNQLLTIRITDLSLRTIIGIYDWEREQKQDIRINIEMKYDASNAIQSDDVKEAVDYKTITKEIIEKVEASEFFLIEKLTNFILNIVMKNSAIKEATVRIDKPFALRFAKSVSTELTAKRS